MFMNSPFLFSNIILKIIKLCSKKNFNKFELSDILLLYIQNYIKKIIRNTAKYMILLKKKTMTVFDIKNANTDDSELKFIDPNQSIFKILKTKSRVTPILKKNKIILNNFINQENKNFEFFFVLKNWFLFDSNKKYNSFDQKTIFKKEFSFKQYSKLKDIAFFLLLNKEFNLYRYIIVKLEDGNYIEKDFCLESLSTYEKINNLIPHLIIYLNGSILRNNTPFFRIKLVVKIIRALCINKFSNIDNFVNLILPILLKFIIDRFEKFDLNEIYSLKKYTANVISIIYNRIGIQRNQFYLKIIPIFSNIIFKYKNNISKLYGSLLGIAALGYKMLELLVFPYLIKIIRYLDFEVRIKKINFNKLTEISHLYKIIKKIILSYCVKKKLENLNNRKIKKKMFYILKKIGKTTRLHIKNL